MKNKAGNLYNSSARFYDFDNRDNMLDDIPFYLEYAHRQAGSHSNAEILELGCGTGRVSIILAEAGFSVTGLDLSFQMLEVFREKLEGKKDLSDKITITCGNMARFSFDRKFSMIIAPFRAFQALTDDGEIDSALLCIREHLSGEGIFIVNVFNPRPVMDESWCYGEVVQWDRLDEKSGIRVVKKHWGDKIDTQNRVIYPHFAFEVTYPDGRAERIVDDLSLKYYYNEQLRAVIEKAGMEICEEYSWYDKAPKNGREIIFICKKAK